MKHTRLLSGLLGLLGLPSAPTLLATAAVAGLCLAPACKGADKSDDSEQKSDDDGGDGGSLGSMGPLAKMFASGLTEAGPYDAPRKSADFDEKKPHLLVIELDKPIAEVESISMFGTSTGTPLRSLQNKLGEAAADPLVEGIVLRSSGFSISMALAQELRLSLKEFRDAGKSVHCHTEGVSNAAYYVLTACETIGLSPLGDVVVSGAAAAPIHVKGLLDRVGVTADFLHVGAYKGAAEPITRDEPSPQMIETLEALLDESYTTLVAGLVEGRGIGEDEAKAAIDKAMYVANEAVEAKLVDEVSTWESFVAATGKPWQRGDQAENPLEDMGALQRFVGLLPADRPSKPHVALVYAVGNVIDGKGSGVVGARQEIASRTLVSALHALGKDDNVKAVVLRVSSPGGSARASELIWHAVAEVKKVKPVIVSMGGVAASGGYYISAGATKIFAEDNTITGSIGVVGGKLVFGDALAAVGVNNFEVKRGERALMWSSMKPWTTEERAAVQQMMQLTYDEFVGRVAEGRSMERDAVHTIAQGRVWTGAAAKERGLVDEIGGLDAALAAARELGGVEADTALEVYPGKPTLRDLLSSFGAVQAQGVLGHTTIAAALGELATLAGPDIAAKTHRVLSSVIALRDARLWTMSWVAPL
ncbi:MAG: signal peptide peptidase SppA [Myxococcota bacterium]